MSRHLPFLFARIFNTPLLVAAGRLDAFMLGLPGLLDIDRGGPRLDAALLNGIAPQMFDQSDEQQQREQRPPVGYRIRDGVALMPVHGVLVKRAGQMTPDCTPLESYERISARLRGAMSDSRVRGILLDLDTPGGESGGTMDLAREIRQHAQVKPIWAHANDDALSAGYAIASAATRLWTTRTGAVGSIGVVGVHTDQSEADARQGLRYTYIHAGARKIDGHTHAPLTAEAHARIQQEVDRLQGMFIETVASHRALTVEAVRGTEAGIYCGDEGIRAGLADQVGTLDEAHAALAAHVSPSTSRRTQAMSETTQPTTEAPSAPAPAPTPPAPDATVVALASATQHATERATEIASLCALAGQPSLASEMIASTRTTAEVTRHLLSLRAQQAAVVTAVDPAEAARAEAPALNRSEMIAARYP